MPLSDATKDLLTFGAHSRVEEKREAFGKLRRELEATITERDAAVGRTNTATEKLIAAKVRGVEALRGLSEIAKNLRAADRNPGEKNTTSLPAPAWARIESVLSEAEIINHAKKGMATGVSLALGTWALAGTAGITGAGAAIGASTLAQSALIGGGAMAAGGAAAGAIAIGGLVLLPAAAILAIFSHNSADQKIREIEAETAKLMITLEESRGALLAFQNLERRALEVTSAIEKTAEVFEVERLKCLHRIYPWGKLSRALKGIRKMLGGDYFSKRDLVLLLPLIDMARILADLIDQKILDERGNLK